MTKVIGELVVGQGQKVTVYINGKVSEVVFPDGKKGYRLVLLRVDF